MWPKLFGQERGCGTPNVKEPGGFGNLKQCAEILGRKGVMAYPVPEASYKHTPKFVDRMKEAEAKQHRPYQQESPVPEKDFATMTPEDVAPLPVRKE